MTNGDRIRQMSNEELFENYLIYVPCYHCDFFRDCKNHCNGSIVNDVENYKECSGNWLKWLRKEEGENEQSL